MFFSLLCGGLQVNENESLFKRKQRLEEQKRHKEELIRAHEEAEQVSTVGEHQIKPQSHDGDAKSAC